MKFTLTTIIDATPERIYKIWLSSKGHSEMTVGDAICSEKIVQS